LEKKYGTKDIPMHQRAGRIPSKIYLPMQT
jgi:hypothetical protein